MQKIIFSKIMKLHRLDWWNYQILFYLTVSTCKTVKRIFPNSYMRLQATQYITNFRFFSGTMCRTKILFHFYLLINMNHRGWLTRLRSLTFHSQTSKKFQTVRSLYKLAYKVLNGFDKKITILLKTIFCPVFIPFHL